MSADATFLSMYYSNVSIIVNNYRRFKYINKVNKKEEMAFRQTTFNPTQSQQFRVTNGGPVAPNGQINMAGLEENLAREMARMKMDKEKQMREIDKICAESPELKELQNKIK